LTKGDALYLDTFALLCCVQPYYSAQRHVKVKIGIRVVDPEELEPEKLVRNLLTWDVRIHTNPLR
jgi:hypothetical protein